MKKPEKIPLYVGGKEVSKNTLKKEKKVKTETRSETVGGMVKVTKTVYKGKLVQVIRIAENPDGVRFYKFLFADGICFNTNDFFNKTGVKSLQRSIGRFVQATVAVLPSPVGVYVENVEIL